MNNELKIMVDYKCTKCGSNVSLVDDNTNCAGFTINGNDFCLDCLIKLFSKHCGKYEKINNRG